MPNKLTAFGLKLLLLLSSLGAGLLLAEFLSHAVLPPSQSFPLPLIRMEYDPQAGYKYRPNQQGYMTTGFASINSWGFRGKNWTKEKPAGILRVALLGDSYVVGQGVQDEETFASQLENRLNVAGQKFEVLNFGASGYDWGHEFKVLEYYALSFKPDFVVLAFFLNDLLFIEDYEGYKDLFTEGRPPLLWNLQNAVRKSRLLMYLWDLWHGHKVNEMTKLEEEYVNNKGLPPSGAGQKGWEFTLTQLKKFSELSQKHGFTPILAVIPTPKEIQKNSHAPYVDFLTMHAKTYGIRTVALIPENTPSPSSLLIPYDGHFSPAGHKLAAEVLEPVVLRENS